MDESVLTSLLLLNPSGTNTGYCSVQDSLDEVERMDSHLDTDVICIEDSPISISSTVNEEMSNITPCSSVHEEEDNASVVEIFVSAKPGTSRETKPPLFFLEDQDDGVSSSCSISVNMDVQDYYERITNKEEPSTSRRKENRLIKRERDFTVPCLETRTSLKARYESKFKLHMRLRKAAGISNAQNFRRKFYKYKKHLHKELDDWENYLNEQSAQEAYIAVENVVDNEGPPKDFIYVTNNVMHQDMPSHLFDIDYLVGCSCERICTMETCDCPRNGGGEFAYDRNGRVRVKPGTPIYECNPRCPCSLSCRNRVLQRGRTVKVAIFRTPNDCGWGVKTMEHIEKNQMVTEYVGEAITQEEAEERGKVYDSRGQTYLFDLDFNDGECLYTLDAKKYGNISHFINHSCDPNLDVYAVWVDTLDPNFPRIALFANRNIEVGEELTFDYQMSLDTGSSCSSPRKKEHLKCRCGAEKCRTFLF